MVLELLCLTFNFVVVVGHVNGIAVHRLFAIDTQFAVSIKAK